MTLQLRHIKKCQWNRGWYVQLTEWIKPITVSKLKFKWMCFPHGVPWCSLSLHIRRGGWNAGDERSAHVSCLSHRCQITSGRSARATSPCAAGASTAVATRAGASAAGSEDSPQQPPNINLLSFFCLTDLFLTSFSNASPVLQCFVSSLKRRYARALWKNEELFFFVFILYVLILSRCKFFCKLNYM